MKYKLKPGRESFTVMSGVDEGKTFVRGRVYNQVPEGYEDRFNKVPEAKKSKQEVKEPETEAPDKTPEKKSKKVNGGKP